MTISQITVGEKLRQLPKKQPADEQRRSATARLEDIPLPDLTDRCRSHFEREGNGCGHNTPPYSLILEKPDWQETLTHAEKRYSVTKRQRKGRDK